MTDPYDKIVMRDLVDECRKERERAENAEAELERLRNGFCPWCEGPLRSTSDQPK